MYDTMIYNSIESLDVTQLQDFYDSIFLTPVKPIAKGEGLRLAVLDSGVDFMHPLLQNRVHGVYNVISQNTENTIDKVGHGTYISGLICNRRFGIVPNVQHYAIKVTDDYGNLNADTICAGIQWCINNSIDIICMAFGSRIYNAKLEKMVAFAHQAGIIMIASAGNNSDMIEYPACFPEVLCAGSIDYSLQRVEFSATGSELDIVLPAVDIPSLYSFCRYAKSSGSSSATAIGTGIVAMIQYLRMRQAGIKFNLQQLKRWFAENAIDLGDYGYDNIYGLGVPTFARLAANHYDISYF